MLDNNDLMVLSRTGEQLKNVIRHLLQEFPKSANSIAGMAKWLGIKRSNSQRLLNAVNKSRDGKEVICMLPGVAGIEEFIELCQDKNIKPLLIKDARKALESFQANISQYSRSHSDLKRQLNESILAENSETLANPPSKTRAIHYESIRDLIGESTEFLFCAYILSENQSNPNYLKEYAIVSKQNTRHIDGARPFFQHYSHKNLPGFKGPEKVTQTTRFTDDQFHVGIAEPFSSDEVINGYSGYSANHSCLVFNNISNRQSPFDATFVFSNPDEIENPLKSNTKSSSTAISIKNPTKRLIMMVFMERKLDMCSTVNVGCYSANHPIPEGHLSADEVWNDRLPEFPELKIVNQDSPIAKQTDSLEYGELSDFLFQLAGLDKQEFVCYMMDVPYPIWSSCYRIYFEHG